MRREHRLRRPRDFERVRSRRRSWAHPLLVCYTSPRGDHGPSRVGIVVGRRVGKAVMRNRVKRRIREAARSVYPQMQPGYDLLLVARPAAATATFFELASALGTLIDRARLRRPPERGSAAGNDAVPDGRPSP